MKKGRFRPYPAKAEKSDKIPLNVPGLSFWMTLWFGILLVVFVIMTEGVFPALDRNPNEFFFWSVQGYFLLIASIEIAFEKLEPENAPLAFVLFAICIAVVFAGMSYGGWEPFVFLALLSALSVCLCLVFLGERLQKTPSPFASFLVMLGAGVLMCLGFYALFGESFREFQVSSIILLVLAGIAASIIPEMESLYDKFKLSEGASRASLIASLRLCMGISCLFMVLYRKFMDRNETQYDSFFDDFE